jgi:hypothetical protein
VQVSPELWDRVDATIDTQRVSGARYAEPVMREIDTDEPSRAEPADALAQEATPPSSRS